MKNVILFYLFYCVSVDSFGCGWCDGCCDCCSGVKFDDIKFYEKIVDDNNQNLNGSKYYEEDVNNDQMSNFSPINYKNSDNKWNKNVIQSLNRDYFKIDTWSNDFYKKLANIYQKAFLFFINLSYQESNKKIVKKINYKIKETYDNYFSTFEKQYNVNNGIDTIPFWNSYGLTIQSGISKSNAENEAAFLCFDYNRNASNMGYNKSIEQILDSKSHIYILKDIVAFLFGYLNECIEAIGDEESFTLGEYSSHIEDILNIFLYITQGLQHCGAGQMEAITVAFSNAISTFLEKNPTLKLSTEDICSLCMNIYAKKVFNMVFTFDKINDEDWNNIHEPTGGISNYRNEKSMYVMTINNLVSDYFGFSFVNDQGGLDMFIFAYGINYDTVDYLVKKNTYERIKLNSENKIDINDINNDEYRNDIKTHFTELYVEILKRALVLFFDSAFEETMMLQIVNGTKNKKLINYFNSLTASQQKSAIVKKILIHHGFFKEQEDEYKYVSRGNN